MRLIEGGCDPMLVARRLVVHSAEDVGMADPRALQIATSALYALEKIGYPEAMIPLAQAIIYVCEAEKSNSVVEALYAAKRDAREVRDDDIPAYLKDSSYGGEEDKANSRLYKYPHAYGGYVEQQYLPDSLKDRVYYKPGKNGYENEVKETRKRKGKKD
jgi:putative ATPase